MTIGMHWSDCQRPARHRDAGLREQPTRHQRLGERHRSGEAPSDPQYRETVGHCCPGAAKIIGNPGERQPRLFERIPQRLGPLTFLGLVDGCRLAQILKDPGRGIDDDVVGIVAHAATRVVLAVAGDRRAGEGGREAAARQIVVPVAGY